MRITGIGHAGLFIETAHGSILCDPWVNPAFFGSWFPFPDNTGLDWDRMGQADYLYVSHLHRDHFDAALLTRHVRKDARVLLPDFPTDELEVELADLGFRTFVRTKTGEPFDLDGLRLMVTSLTGPSDGPIGDSALSVDDGETVILNQNDAHPLDVPAIREFGEVDGYLLQFSGAIWWPMVYDLPLAARQEFARRKREGQTERAFRYIDDVQAANVFPTAGPPCFLDDDLFHLNGEGAEGESIFTDQAQFLDRMAESGRGGGHLLLPGTVASLRGRECVVEHLLDGPEIERIFTDKTAYLRDYAARRRPDLEAEQASRAAVPSDLLDQLKAWWEPLMARADNICSGVGGGVRLDVGDRSIVLDFVAREVRDFDGERCRYRLSTSAELIATCLERREVDWSNSLFLSCRFTASRVGNYNEFVYMFFKSLSVERIDYVENWYDEQNDDGEDVQLDGWNVQRRCPHLRADLSKFGSIEGDVLTCAMHGWRFDLPTGRCLTSRGHELRASRVEEPVHPA